MKKIIAAVIAAMVLTSCNKATAPENENVYTDPAVINTMSFPTGTEPFSRDIFRFSGTNGEYIVTVSPSDTGILVGIEDSTFHRRETEILPPAGYIPYFPEFQINAEYAVNVIRNDLTNEKMPDLMQFSFMLENTSADAPLNISTFYTIDDSGELAEISLFDTTVEKGKRSHIDYLDRIQLNHTEPDKFIYEISVDDTNIYDEEGRFIPVEGRVKIKLLVFDKRSLTMKIVRREISESDPLYFGYAYWAAANTAAEYFTVSLFPETDYNIQEETEDGTYFRVRSERFPDLSSLYKNLLTIFSNDTAASLYADAPQKYRDINGKLYTLDRTVSPDTALGTLTFTDMYVTDTTMLFYSRQVKYDSDGNFEAYTDGGNFIISCRESDYWKIIGYRYPYS